MAKVKVLKDNELIGGADNTSVYPVTSVKAVYDESNERLDNIIHRIETATVPTEKLENAAVTTEKLAKNSISESKIIDNNITNRKIANDTIEIEKLSTNLRNTIKAATGVPEDLVKDINTLINILTWDSINNDIDNDTDNDIVTLGQLGALLVSNKEYPDY